MDELADTEKEFPDRVYEMQASLVHNVLMFIEVQNKEGMIEFPSSSSVCTPPPHTSLLV